MFNFCSYTSCIQPLPLFGTLSLRMNNLCWHTPFWGRFMPTFQKYLDFGYSAPNMYTYQSVNQPLKNNATNNYSYNYSFNYDANYTPQNITFKNLYPMDFNNYDSFNETPFEYNYNNLNYWQKTNKQVNYSLIDYKTLSRSSALDKAKNDPNLEKLTGGANWKISEASFKNDIPYAGKGINKFLNKLTEELNINLTITSALGTASSPHAKNGSHYDGKNPKLDFGGGLSEEMAKELVEKLNKTDYFEYAKKEDHGDGTSHLDVKIKDSTLKKFAETA